MHMMGDKYMLWNEMMVDLCFMHVNEATLYKTFFFVFFSVRGSLSFYLFVSALFL